LSAGLSRKSAMTASGPETSGCTSKTVPPRFRACAPHRGCRSEEFVYSSHQSASAKRILALGKTLGRRFEGRGVMLLSMRRCGTVLPTAWQTGLHTGSYPCFTAQTLKIARNRSSAESVVTSRRCDTQSATSAALRRRLALSRRIENWSLPLPHQPDGASCVLVAPTCAYCSRQLGGARRGSGR
jgi:hypothetical protein